VQARGIGRTASEERADRRGGQAVSRRPSAEELDDLRAGRGTPQTVLALQGDIGNAATGQVIGRPRSAHGPGPAVQRAPATETPSATAHEQSAGHAAPNITFTAGGVRVADFQQKADRIIDLLRRHKTLVSFLGRRPCRITLKPNSDPRVRGTPAEVVAKDHSVEVWVAEYYFTKYSTAYVVGMLAHEFGVHPMASIHEDVQEEDSAYAEMQVPIPVPGL